MIESKQQELIRQTIQSQGFSGVVSVCEQKTVILEEFSGYIDFPNQVPINIDTRFAIASGTKLFTALGIMRLQEEGKLNINDPAFSYISTSFPSYSKDITIKQLLTHTSGLPDYFDEEQIKQTGNLRLPIPWYELRKPSDYIQVMPHTPMVYEPGTSFAYNNSAFVFLAIIIEELTGDYYQWIEQEILHKAHMNSSGFFLLNQLPSNCANGYISIEPDNYQTNIYHMPIIAGGDGGMFTCANDMNLFWRSLFNGQIVQPSTLKEILHPHHKTDTMSYGLGVWLEREDEQYNPVLFGEDPGVSFTSGYNILTKRVHTILSNTTDGAWKLSNLI